MCEPFITAKTGLTVTAHQHRTVSNLIRLRDLAPDLPIIPVLQGWTIPDYLHCIDLLFPVTQNEHEGDVQDEHVEPDIPGVYPAVRAHGGGVLLTVSRRAVLAAASWSW